MSSEAPGPDLREWMLGVMAGLCRDLGSEPFLCAPITVPSALLPRPLEHGPRVIEALARRVASHARMPWLGVRVLDLRPPGAPPAVRTELSLCAAPLLHPWEPVLELELRALGDPADDVALVASHVTRAFCVLHDAVGPTLDAYRELPAAPFAPERLGPHASIVAVYLGLGIVAANAALELRARAGGTYETPHDHPAGLGPRALAFLIAAQLVARGADGRAIAVVRGALTPRASLDVQHWVHALAPRAEALREQLGIEPRSASAAASARAARLR